MRKSFRKSEREGVRINLLPTGQDKVEKPGLSFSKLEQLQLQLLPDYVRKVSGSALELATRLFQEGVRGAACRELLSKEVALQKLRLDLLDGLTAAETEPALRGKEEAVAKLKLVDRLTARGHKRMLSAIEMLARLDPSAASVTVATVECEAVVQ